MSGEKAKCDDLHERFWRQFFSEEINFFHRIIFSKVFGRLILIHSCVMRLNNNNEQNQGGSNPVYGKQFTSRVARSIPGIHEALPLTLRPRKLSLHEKIRVSD